MTYRVEVQPTPSFVHVKAPSGKVFVVLHLPKSRRNGVWVDPEEWTEIVSQWNAYVERLVAPTPPERQQSGKEKR